MNKIVKDSCKLFGGSAVAGMGFSFGRDVYKKIKKNFYFWAFLIISIFGIYTAGVWISRNYKSIWGSIGYRILALGIGVPSFAILSGISLVFLMVLIAPESSGNTSESTTDTEQEVALVTPNTAGSLSNVSSEDELYALIAANVVIFGLPTSILGIGLLVGFFQRGKRARVWKAEEANEIFMLEHSLKEHEDGTIEDSSEGQNYRVDHMGKERITLMPLGKRGKRAYIEIGDDGIYKRFTGLV